MQNNTPKIVYVYIYSQFEDILAVPVSVLKNIQQPLTIKLIKHELVKQISTFRGKKGDLLDLYRLYNEISKFSANQTFDIHKLY
jgi:hypothetical protein